MDLRETINNFKSLVPGGIEGKPLKIKTFGGLEKKVQMI